MQTYAVISSPMAARITVHSARCRCVEAARARRDPVEYFDADSAERAAADAAEKYQLTDRGFKKPVVCKCAK